MMEDKSLSQSLVRHQLSIDFKKRNSMLPLFVDYGVEEINNSE